MRGGDREEPPYSILPWAPAFEDVIQLAREKTVANFCSIAAVMDAFAQPLVRRSQTYPGDLSTKFGKSFDLLQPFFGKANWITSSQAGVQSLPLA